MHVFRNYSSLIFESQIADLKENLISGIKCAQET